MKEPTHNIKLYSGNNIPCPDSTWYEIAPHWYQNSARGWLGSGVKDKNGVEIFEGDIVKIFDVFGNDKENIQPVTFHNGAFWTGDGLLVNLTAESLEVVAHIAEEQP